MGKMRRKAQVLMEFLIIMVFFVGLSLLFLKNWKRVKEIFLKIADKKWEYGEIKKEVLSLNCISEDFFCPMYGDAGGERDLIYGNFG
jgi:hypothetical protein